MPATKCSRKPEQCSQSMVYGVFSLTIAASYLEYTQAEALMLNINADEA